MTRKHRIHRQSSYGGSARFKLGLNLPGDRTAAARLLMEARNFGSMRGCRKSSWQRTLDIAASFAAREAELSGDDRQFRIYDHIAYMMESLTEADA